MKEAKEKTTKNIKDVIEFVKQLVKILFALSIIGLGFYAVVVGKTEADMLIKQIALVVSGMCAVTNGFYMLFKTIMRK
jgi:hypothetical protein